MKSATTAHATRLFRADDPLYCINSLAAPPMFLGVRAQWRVGGLCIWVLTVESLRSRVVDH